MKPGRLRYVVSLILQAACGVARFTRQFTLFAVVVVAPRAQARYLHVSHNQITWSIPEDKRLAVGTDSGHVDLFNTYALKLYGPTDPYKSLEASGYVYALAVLEDKGLAVGTDEDVDLFNTSVLEMQGS